MHCIIAWLYCNVILYRSEKESSAEKERSEVSHSIQPPPPPPARPAYHHPETDDEEEEEKRRNIFVVVENK